MKVAACLLALAAFAASAPQPRKDFHEHFEDFIDVIMKEARDDIGQLLETYMQFDDFKAALAYMQTTSFKDIILEMESLPEFQAVVDFLEADNIDITFFLDIINEGFNVNPTYSRISRQVSGTSVTSFIQDSIAVFPKEKLNALFQQKGKEDEEFRTAIDNLFSDEWKAVFTALLETPQFQQESATLLEIGIDLHAFVDEIVAVFGQN